MNQPLKVWDYLKEYRAEKAEILGAVERVFESGWLILGTEVKGFEQEFSSYIGCSYGIGVNSATDALFIGLKALGVGNGDEVITVSNTAVPTVSAIGATGAIARFVDVDPRTYLMDLDQVEKTITEKTKVILPVHLFGQCVDMDRVNAIASKYHLKVIEDCAQAHGATLGDRLAGSMSDLSAFSFYPTKILGGFGDGGMICTQSEEIAEKCRKLRFYGMESQYYSVEEGINSRLDEVHAAILRNKLKKLPEYVDRRNAIAKLYDGLLADSAPLILPMQTRQGTHAFYLYVVRHPQRDIIIKALKEQEISLNISYPWPIHTMTGYVHLGYKLGDLPNTELVQREIFSLPMYPSLEDSEVERVCSVLKEVMRNL